MEADKNNRLDELFNQARNEPSKISYKETKGQFVKSSANLIKGGKGGKLAHFSNLKIIIMIATISAITIGAVLFTYNNSENIISNKTEDINSIEIQQEKNLDDPELLVNEEHEKVVSAHFKKVELLPADLKEIYEVKVQLALKIKEGPTDSLKRYQIELDKSARNKEILDTAYRFPKLTYEETKANNKQKAKMLKQLVKFDKKKYAYIPMGSLELSEKAVSVHAFHMQTTEVSNLEYRTYLFDLLLQGRTDEFLVAKPDQTRWVKDYPKGYNKPMQDHYFSHAAYDQYPVVAVSRKGAELYCEWLTTEANKANKKMTVNDVRIPTNVEWMHAATGGLKNGPYPWGGPHLRNSNGSFLANFMPTRGNYSLDGAFHTAKVNSYNPNDYGLYCMSGNVAEMVYYVDENMLPGTKGGSWTSIGQELQIKEGVDRFKKMETHSVDIGFRPVITFLHKSKNQFIPFGMKKVKQGLYVDESEASNAYWREYMEDLGRKYGVNSSEYKNALPDTTVWKSKTAYNEPYVQYYLRHAAYRTYPVVGITYEQAQGFCVWRTKKMKAFVDNLDQESKTSYPKNFKFRLPTKKEWETIASAGYSEKTLKKLDGKYKGQSRANLKRNKDDDMGVAGNLNDNADVTAPGTSYWPNQYGVYCIFGNVAEMVSEKGIAKGGSWTHDEKDVTVTKDFEYKQQNAWVGFRCVFEVVD